MKLWHWPVVKKFHLNIIDTKWTFVINLNKFLQGLHWYASWWMLKVASQASWSGSTVCEIHSWWKLFSFSFCDKKGLQCVRDSSVPTCARKAVGCWLADRLMPVVYLHKTIYRHFEHCIPSVTSSPYVDKVSSFLNILN